MPLKIPQKPVVVLVQCRNGTQNPGIYFQVTLDPDRVLAGTTFIRFGGWIDGKGQSDELTGWFNMMEWDMALELGGLNAQGQLEYKGNPDE